jgi:hypothetical protein
VPCTDGDTSKQHGQCSRAGDSAPHMPCDTHRDCGAPAVAESDSDVSAMDEGGTDSSVASANENSDALKVVTVRPPPVRTTTASTATSGSRDGVGEPLRVPTIVAEEADLVPVGARPLLGAARADPLAVEDGD